MNARIVFMVSNINWSEQKEKLVSYAEEQGYKVAFKNLKGKSSWISTTQKKIVIHTSSTVELQVYDLMHELGHSVQQKNTKTYQRAFATTFEDFSRQSQTYKIKILEEEIDAWNKGLKLSKRLGVTVDKRNFEIRKASRVATYASWATRQTQIK
jgi:Zn-dependent peptidase ImmA (M78 family)